MADSPNTEAQDNLAKQMADLRREVAKLSKMVGERVDAAKGQASTLYEGAAERASRTAKQLRTQAETVSTVAQENPGTVSAAVATIGLIGFLIGFAVAKATEEQPPRRWYER